MPKGIAAAIVVALVLSGCTLYWGHGGDDDDDDCLYPAQGGAIPPAHSLRNPNTGLCEAIGGDGLCPERCGPCAFETVPLPDWGACNSACEGLDETFCQATPACYAAYKLDPVTDGPPAFWGCWSTAPSGPAQGTCTGLDAYECSRHDDCIAVYAEDASGTPRFAYCAEEPTELCVDDGDCGSGSTCDHAVCYPAPTCTPCETCGACPDCYGVCVPIPGPACETLMDEASCLSRSDCVPVYDGDQCTCYPDGCDCKVLTYARCETP